MGPSRRSRARRGQWPHHRGDGAEAVDGGRLIPAASPVGAKSCSMVGGPGGPSRASAGEWRAARSRAAAGRGNRRTVGRQRLDLSAEDVENARRGMPRARCGRTPPLSKASSPTDAASGSKTGDGHAERQRHFKGGRGDRGVGQSIVVGDRDRQQASDPAILGGPWGVAETTRPTHRQQQAQADQASQHPRRSDRPGDGRMAGFERRADGLHAPHQRQHMDRGEGDPGGANEPSLGGISTKPEHAASIARRPLQTSERPLTRCAFSARP